MAQEGRILESASGVIQQSVALGLLSLLDLQFQSGGLFQWSTEKTWTATPVALPACDGSIHLPLLSSHSFEIAIDLPFLCHQSHIEKTRIKSELTPWHLDMTPKLALSSSMTLKHALLLVGSPDSPSSIGLGQVTPDQGNARQGTC